MTLLHPGANTGVVGSFQYSCVTETLLWSNSVYAIHGFAPGDVVPSLDLVLAHKHPADRDRAAQLLTRVRATGETFSLWHRIIDAQGAHRQVLSVGAGVLDQDGAVSGVAGYLVDLTDEVRRTVAAEVREAVEGTSRSRPFIDQVKGALMLSYALDADAAFALLRRYSQGVNVKVRDVARELAAAISAGELPKSTRRVLDGLVADLARVSTTEAVNGQAAE